MENIFVKLSIVMKLIFRITNWTCPIFKYFNLKDDECVAKFRNGTKCIIRNKSDSAVFLENFFLDSYTQEKGFDIKENDLVIDVGGHVGYFTIYAAKKAKNGKIITFEPSKESFNVLKNNLKINNIQNVIIENVGVGAKSGTAILNVDVDHGIGNSIFFSSKNSEKEDIRITTIPEIVKKYKIESIDLLKLDCEGAEFEIILNLPSTILNTIKKISMEIHEIENFDIIDIEKFLVKNNFSVRRKYFLHENWPILYAKNQNFDT